MVRLPAGWFAGRDPVTQGQYAEVTGERPSHFPGDDDRPVESVSWEDATSFCEQLTARELAAGRLPPGWRYDLPTDAQWDEMLADADPKTAVTSQTVPRDGTVPVAEAGPPNRLGLRGMLGNVWQWCRDWYDEGIRRKDANPDVPAGALVTTGVPGLGNGSPDDPPDERYKVLRGGAWDTGPSAHFSPRARLRYAPGMASARTGFRCVLEPARRRGLMLSADYADYADFRKGFGVSKTVPVGLFHPKIICGICGQMPALHPPRPVESPFDGNALSRW